jgi:DNA-binding beta-propeller fold protein YncE
VATPAGATVDFTKQWIGGSEFLLPIFADTDASGNLYVSDGGFSTSRVLVLDPAGALVSVLGEFGSDPGQFNGTEGVAVDPSGNVYVAEFNGNRVQKFDANGNFVLMFGKAVDNTTGGDVCTAASGDTCTGGTMASTGGAFHNPAGVATDSAGNVYVVDGGNRRVQKFDSDGNFILTWGKGVNQTTAGDLCTAASGDTCQAGTSGSGDGQFTGPVGIATDSSNNVYVGDSGNDRIQKFDSGGTFTSKWGTTGSAGGQFNDLQGIDVDSSDNIYAVDFTNSNVQVFSSAGTFIRSFGKGVNHTTGGDTCTAASGNVCGASTLGTADAQFFGAMAIAVDASGNAYVSDQSPRVQKFDSSGVFVSKVGTLGSGGPFDAGLFYIDIASDSSGNLYTSDHDTSRIQKFDPLGASLNAWGTAGTAGGQVGGPSGTAIDSAGNVYVAEQDNDRVTKYDSGGNFVLTWGDGVNQTTSGDVCTAASGDTCQAGTSGAGDGQFDGPSGLTVDSSGNVYVADSGNDRIQKFDTSGTFLTKWGASGSANSEFNTPTDVATDSLGEVYVTDRDNNRVQRFSSTGAFLGKWGVMGSGNGQFHQPVAVTVDSQRNAYIVDYANARVQVFRPTGAFVETWGSVGAGQSQFNGPSSIALGPGARIYVADAGNNRVEMFTESDTTAPQTVISSGPSGTTNDPTPTFSFTSSQPAGALFECRIDGSTDDQFKPCGSTKTLPHLADGSHTFAVRTIDSAGNVDGSPASRTFMVKTASIARSGSTLVVTAAAPAKDNLKVLQFGGTIRVTDTPAAVYTGSGVHTGAGCTRVGDYRADCSAAGVTLIRVVSGASTDRVQNSTPIPSSLNGGPANDLLIGGAARDTITGATGADTMRGMNGNDRLLARDLANDTSINCDGGTHPGTADRADLDVLPKDSAVSGCETKTRH